DYNKLFQGSGAEQAEFQARTVELWEAIAERYKDNPTVMGYDLLNEPTGVITDYQRLWDFYDQLYDAIRDIDPNHIIVMEAIWDLNTLPEPSVYTWTNVVYQLHTYCPWCEDWPDYDDQVEAHEQFVTDRISWTQGTRDAFTSPIPIMIGEFHAYDSRDVWEHYLERFNDLGWSWTAWTYKMAIPNSKWGFLTDRYYDPEQVPNFVTDTYTTLQTKLSEQFGTPDRYRPNESLVGIVERYANDPYPPWPATRTFQAEDYADSQGILWANDHIAFLDKGDWVRYDAIEFSDDLDAFVAHVAVADTHAGGQIVLSLDHVTGTVVGTLTVAGTGGWWTFAEQQISITPITGEHDVYLTFVGDGVGNIDWFTFKDVLKVSKQATPDPAHAGAQLTYTIRVTNTSGVTLTATITDTLPAHITSGETSSGTLIAPGGIVTWTSVSIMPDSVWTDTVVVTVEQGYCNGSLTNKVEVVTEQGLTGSVV
ncbi:MAG: carbohydrate-binding protein, partial [Chloroflexi bacterium]|nr:carbohydrate-binding protein [Chloroflexota bacterium]